MIDKLNMIWKVVVLALILLVHTLSGISWAERKVYKLSKPDVPEESVLQFTATGEAGYEVEIGSNVFKAYVSRHKIKFAYEGEWHSFEPLNHMLVTALVQGQQITLRNYWVNTDMVLESQPLGLKTSIVLKTADAPKSFQFRIEKSAGWNEEWIAQPFITCTVNSGPFPVGIADIDEAGGILTYTVPQALDTLPAECYPLVIDPTYAIAASVDDTYATLGAADYNSVGATWMYMGQTNFPDFYAFDIYMRFAIDIPQGSTITSAYLNFYSVQLLNGVVDRYIRRLAHGSSPAWRSGGFTLSPYTNGTALDNIAKETPFTVWNPVPTFNASEWYPSPSIVDVLQAQIDDGDYDPGDSVKKYIGYALTQRTWNPGAYTYRSVEPWDAAGTNEVELIVEYDAPPAAPGGPQWIIWNSD